MDPITSIVMALAAGAAAALKPVAEQAIKDSYAVVCPRIMSTDLDGLTCKICFPSLTRGAYNGPTYPCTQEAQTAS
jgi:hypothetical protein